MERPTRKQNRLSGYDYSTAGTYFITICTRNRECSLSKIINVNDDVGDGFPVPQLTGAGFFADKYINLIHSKFPDVNVENYVIMPNHIHIILYLTNGTGNPSPTIGNVIGWFKYAVTKEINYIQNLSPAKFFQRSFHDHIIRNDKEFQKIYKYIDENPLNWESDCFYCN
ncbi:MAG: transposase [Ruminococcus sp.]|nr:transposase [Ruminococcus sp.]MCM1381957.1 transposase [Muribaculaceae bacterium]MCM1479599.1 transposase [Muribaculaceae bacterium]